MTNTPHIARTLARLACALLFLSPAVTVADVFPDPVPLKDINAPRTFQSELKSIPDRYAFTLHAQQTVYVNLLIPEISGARKDFLVEIISERGARYAMDGAYFLKWTPFAGSDGKPYLKGPEIAPSLYPGNYTLSVSNTDNHGSYVLVISNAPGNPEIPQSAAAALFIAKAKPAVFAAAALVAAAVLALYIRRILRHRKIVV